MSDPLADVIALLRPGAPYSKLASAAGQWRVRRQEEGRLSYFLLLAGQACLTVPGHDAVTLAAGDFALIPAAFAFQMTSVPPPPATVETLPQVLPDGSVRIGDPAAPADVQQLIGYCTFGAADAGLLVSLLPDLVVVRGVDRLGVLAQLVRAEARADRPARDVILGHLLQVLLIEAMRSTARTGASPGLVRGLADRHLAPALRGLHGDPARAWTVADLARLAGLSRSALFTRFSAAVGVAPMEYLLGWRMALARDHLRQGRLSIAEIAARVGYGSTSAFSTAFARAVGQPPARYAQGPV